MHLIKVHILETSWISRFPNYNCFFHCHPKFLRAHKWSEVWRFKSRDIHIYFLQKTLLATQNKIVLSHLYSIWPLLVILQSVHEIMFFIPEIMSGTSFESSQTSSTRMLYWLSKLITNALNAMKFILTISSDVYHNRIPTGRCIVLALYIVLIHKCLYTCMTFPFSIACSVFKFRFQLFLYFF